MANWRRSHQGQPKEVFMRYKIFGERTGLKASELALGMGMFGQAWGYGATPEEVRRIIGGFASAGGNFIDTADRRGHRGEPRRVRYRHEVHARRVRQACRHSPGQQPEEYGPVGRSESKTAEDRSHRSLLRSD